MQTWGGTIVNKNYKLEQKNEYYIGLGTETTLFVFSLNGEEK